MANGTHMSFGTQKPTSRRGIGCEIMVIRIRIGCMRECERMRMGKQIFLMQEWCIGFCLEMRMVTLQNSKSL